MLLLGAPLSCVCTIINRVNSTATVSQDLVLARTAHHTNSHHPTQEYYNNDQDQNPAPFKKHSKTIADMPVPFEAVLHMGMVVVMFGVAGTGYNIVRRLAEDGKPIRHSLDDWERMMMKRDERLTGSWRGQSTNPIAPKEFATNSVWSTEKIL